MLETLSSTALLAPKKGSPVKRTGHTLLVAAQYIQKTPKINGLLAFWLTVLG
jgi:hypothetical protein